MRNKLIREKFLNYDYSDNELKYNILGVNSLKNPNYNIIKDINNYLEDYENRYKIK